MSYQGYENFPPQQGEDPNGQQQAGLNGGQPQMPPPGNGQYSPNMTGMQQGGSGQESGSHDSKTTLWYVHKLLKLFRPRMLTIFRMGELEPWIDDNFIRQLWSHYGEVVNVKMIRDKFTGNNAGYCFIDFASTEAASKAITLNGQPVPNSNRTFKLNWASGGGLADRARDDRGPEFSVFVGDLGPEVNELVLANIFQSKYKSCKSAKIMSDPMTGMSRGYGFVRFGEEADQQRSLSEMQGVYCGNRPMRISQATPKNKGAQQGPGGMPPMHGGMHGGPPGPPGPMGMYQQMGHPPMGFYGSPQPMNQFTDPNNTTVFVGGLSGYVTEDELRSFFQGFGEITYVKIPPGKGCGFVQFVQRHAAEMAINQMQGYPIGNSRVRLSWGRSQNNSGPAGTPYRPAPPPPAFGSMNMPPQHGFNQFAPMKVCEEHTPAFFRSGLLT